MIRVPVALVLLLCILPRLSGAASCDAVEGLSDSAISTPNANPHVQLHEVQATPLLLEFNSGAKWELCWHIDPHAGLVISRVYYGAPAMQPRQVLDAGSLGQILFKYDEDIEATHLLSEAGLGGTQTLIPQFTDCDNGELLAGVADQLICQRLRPINLMTRVRRQQSIIRHELSLHSWSQIGTHLFQQIWRLSEDGEITPSVVFSGHINRYTDNEKFGIRLVDSNQYAASATLLFNWRLDFNINGTPLNDVVDEIDFPSIIGDEAKRAISISQLPVETMRTTDRENFRGWRISDAEHSSGTQRGASAVTRIGYYLDPQTAGYRYVSRAHQWPRFDFFVSARHACEKLSSANKLIDSDCAGDLGEFVNDEPLQGVDTVVWFSVSKHFSPRLEDYPAIGSMETGFKLLPFDWSAHSPFSPQQETRPSLIDSTVEQEVQ